jgi:multisubunit Na+/H+ antiporter MnhF subunit
MKKNWVLNKLLWVYCSMSALFVSLMGLLSPAIYDKVVTKSLIPGILAQDIMTALLGFLMLLLYFFVKENEYKKNLIILGILGYFFTPI